MDHSFHFPFFVGGVIFFENDTDDIVILLKK